jgi:hypothetical protein
MIDALILAVAGVALVLVGAGVLYRTSAVLHYRIRHDGKSLYRVLCTRLRPGDSCRKTDSLLGTGKEPSEAQRDRLLEAVNKCPEFYPDGVLATDVFLDYRYDGSCWMSLQFREGKLVNHDPAQFTRYEPLCCLAAPPAGLAADARSSGPQAPNPGTAAIRFKKGPSRR